MMPKIYQCAACAIGFAVILMGWLYVGPYRWLAEWQLEHRGKYDTFFTGLIVAVLLFLPVAGVIWIVQRWRTGGAAPSRAGRGDRSERAPASRRSRWANEVEDSVSPRGGVLRWLSWTAIFLGAVFIIIAAYMHIRAGAMTQQEHLSISALEAGTKPSSNWVSVSGIALTDAASDVVRDNTPSIRYVPIVSDPAAARGGVAAYIRVLERRMGLIETGAVAEHDGVLDELELPGPVRVDFERRGFGPAPKYFVIGFQQDPRRLKRTSAGFIRAGSYILIGGICLGAVSWWLRARFG
ncbi:MAG: hypothetical protein SYC29_01500 [Planctomycetota bacterium]|nr:hypothetical protein [Planctomycetota bacterium]